MVTESNVGKISLKVTEVCIVEIN